MAAAAFVLLGLAASVHAALRWVELSRALAASQTAAATTERALPSPRLTRDTASAARLAALSRSAHYLNTPWATILDELERHARADVALLALDPDAGQARLRLELEAPQLKSLVDFAQRLGTSSTFERVTLGKHELVDRDPAKAVRMSLEVKLASLPTLATLPPLPTAGGPP